MNTENITLSEISLSHRKTNTVGFHLYEVSEVVKFTETENRVAAASTGDGAAGSAM